jgi:splicing factor U2AF subunit
MTQWDIRPAGYENITAEQAKLSGMFPLPGAPRAAPMDPTRLAAFMSPSAGTASTAALQPLNSKQAKRLYIHNMPADATSEEIIEFFNLQLNGLNVVSGRDPCLSAQIAANHEYALLEFKTAEDATIALAMNGITMRDNAASGPDQTGLSIRRPKDYITPTRDENAYSGDEVSSDVKDSPNKLSIVNIPTYIEEEQVRELVETMGKLYAFVLVKDTSTDQHRVSRAYFCCNIYDCTNFHRVSLSASTRITKSSMQSSRVSTTSRSATATSRFRVLPLVCSRLPASTAVLVPFPCWPVPRQPITTSIAALSA